MFYEASKHSLLWFFGWRNGRFVRADGEFRGERAANKRNMIYCERQQLAFSFRFYLVAAQFHTVFSYIRRFIRQQTETVRGVWSSY